MPQALRGQAGLKGELIRSLETNDFRQAVRRLADVMAEFDAQIAAAKAGLNGPPTTFESVVEVLEMWRVGEIGGEMNATDWMEVDHSGVDRSAIWVDPESSDLNAALADARAFFNERPDASRSVAMPPETAMMLGRLQAAMRDPAAWVEVPRLDAELDAAYAEATADLAAPVEEYDKGGVACMDLGDPGEPQELPSWLRERARAAFVPLLYDVVQTREWARSRAAALLAAATAAKALPDVVQLAPALPTYVPREGDRTLAELVKAFKAAKAENLHRYVHIIGALEQIVGEHRPVRAITRTDVKAAVAFMRRIPSNYAKRWPGLTLTEAVEKADADGLEGRLSSGSVDTYVAHMRSLFAWALDEGWIEESPTANLKVASEQTTKRRAFTTAELVAIFESLAPFRASEPERWWVPALGLYTGARLNELCQLRVADVEQVDGSWVLSLSEFGSDGKRVIDKSLKTAASERFVPVHPALISVGFLDYVQERRAAGAERLFGRLKPGPNGGWSHEFSKWWGRHLDRIGVKDAGATFHSYRHGWREAAGLAGLGDRQIDAIGGWAAKGQAARYGRRTVVEELAPLIGRIHFGGFSLPG